MPSAMKNRKPTGVQHLKVRREALRSYMQQNHPGLLTAKREGRTILAVSLLLVLIESLWPLIVGIWGILKGTWGV